MKVLITAGPTREPIDAVRYIGNRSSGRMGAAIASAATTAGHAVTLILGPVSVPMPAVDRRIDVETASQMHLAVLGEFPAHDLLIMAAAVADYRPKHVHAKKLARTGGTHTIECEPTEDILAAAGVTKQPDQRTVGFSLEMAGNLARAREKLVRKRLDLIVYNPTQTMGSDDVESVLLWADGRTENLASRSKAEFGEVLVNRASELFSR
ncbi:MAG TPA: phosphopantothenoylcysteine decarboxylase [Tepidisphaeraceae bacterium]|jgi:phosphopantothenoylcysteine decarboxylase/phosphopantothenate--cysteine ligase